MKRTVYNGSGKVVNGIVEGRMIVIPAGDAQGGPGTAVLNDGDAQEMLKRFPEALSLAAEMYSEAEIGAVPGLEASTLVEFCQGLMRGVRPKFEAVQKISAERTKGTEGTKGTGKAGAVPGR